MPGRRRGDGRRREAGDFEWGEDGAGGGVERGREGDFAVEWRCAQDVVVVVGEAPVSSMSGRVVSRMAVFDSLAVYRREALSPGACQSSR